ncbi:MAG: hypothetical protein HOE90_12650 [Bacteriovoracaceae bacterium]|jgi:hypothetical protein|nr:hypothetical protein [Bacteriovoracaceae bacterium]
MLAATFIISLFLNSADGVSAEAEKSLLTESTVNSQQNDFGAEASTFFWTIPNSQSDYDSEFIGAKLGVKYHLDSGTYITSSLVFGQNRLVKDSGELGHQNGFGIDIEISKNIALFSNGLGLLVGGEIFAVKSLYPQRSYSGSEGYSADALAQGALFFACPSFTSGTYNVSLCGEAGPARVAELGESPFVKSALGLGLSLKLAYFL